MNLLIKNTDTNEIERWTLEDVLQEINRDHSADWTPYDESDWLEGWYEWCEGEYYHLITWHKEPRINNVITEKEACEIYKQVNSDWDEMDDCLMIDFMVWTLGYTTGILKKEQTLIFYKN